MTFSTNQTNYDLLYDKEYYSEYLCLEHFINKKLGFRVIDNCYILPGAGIFDSNGDYVDGSYFMEDQKVDHYKCTNLSIISAEENINLNDVPEIHSTVVYLGALAGIWGHFITDSMRLLWFPLSESYRENFADCPLVYLPCLKFNLKGSFKRFLEILNINISMMRRVECLTKYDRIILPEESFFHKGENLRCFTQEYITTIETIRNYALKNSQPVTTCKPKKIYYSYSAYSKYRTVGEDKLERYFASKGYEIIYPEKLSLDEQLNLLINCESFASTIGSSSHNIIFLRDDTEVILIPRSNNIAEYQIALDHVHSLRISYVDSSFSIFSGKYPNIYPFLFFISSNLRKYFHDDETESIVNIKDFKKYLRVSLGYSTSKIITYADNPETYRYYSVVAADYFSKLFDSSWLVRLKKWLKSVPALRNFFKRLIR